MSVQQTVTHEEARCSQGVRSLGLSHAAMSEVQIGVIPKLSSWEVASTP
jgi:hypothetical protein